MLSAEAQFAMLKGYEDILCTSLLETFPEYGPFINRSSTPTDTSLKVEGTLDNRPPSNQNDSYKNDNAKSQSNPFLQYSVSPPNSARRPGSDSGSRQDMRRMSYPIDFHHNACPPIKIPVKKQLTLSYRYQNAMDILDTMKDHKGLVVTSQRYRSQGINPIQHYNNWNGEWTKEFKIGWRNGARFLLRKPILNSTFCLELPTSTVKSAVKLLGVFNIEPLRFDKGMEENWMSLISTLYLCEFLTFVISVQIWLKPHELKALFLGVITDDQRQLFNLFRKKIGFRDATWWHSDLDLHFL